MIQIRRSNERGRASFGWLNSRHSFSFGSYYDPAHMGHSVLRVINDDEVAPGAGFDPHGHRDMEIISYVLEGAIEHKDSEGNVQTLPAGEFQLMSAGSGIMHSEYNASRHEPLRFLQIWVLPNVSGEKPGYQQKDFGRAPGLTAVITPQGDGGTLRIKQDATLYQLLLNTDYPSEQLTLPARKAYVHLIEGELSVNGEVLSPGDGVAIQSLNELRFEQQGDVPVKALVFDLP
ncbi:pirin family protein [Reinekea blandensis]|nr:pirin family protein [Reinekea blandensis]